MLNAQPGTLDAAFGNNGIVRYKPGGICQQDSIFFPNCMALQPDGKILIGGMFTGNSIGRQESALVRLNTNGTLDNTFGNNGLSHTYFSGTDQSIRKVVLLSNGKIMALGGVLDTVNNRWDALMSRYLADGQLDTTFLQGWGGYAQWRPNGYSGNLVVTGATMLNESWIVFCGMISGSEDTSFIATIDTSGFSMSFFNTYANKAIQSVSVSADKKIAAVGYVENSPTDKDMLAIMLNEDGSANTNFNGSGMAALAFANKDDVANSVVFDNNGGLLLAGYVQHPISNVRGFGLCKVDSNGQVVGSFGSSGVMPGWSYETFNNLGASAKHIALQTDGKILLEGIVNDTVLNGNSTYGAPGLMRFKSDGVIDSTFGVNGKVQTHIGSNPYVIDYMMYGTNGMALQSDSKIVVVGNNYPLNCYQTLALRYLNSLALGLNDFTPATENVFVYPNPLQPNNTLQFELANTGKVEVEMLNAEGKLISTLMSETKNAGLHRINFEAGDLPSGIYLLRVITSNGSSVIKVIR